MLTKGSMLLFDLDGTLWDSAVSVAESWNMEIERVTGRESRITPDDIRRNMGKTMDDIADDLMAEYPPEERYALARKCEVFENAYISEHGGELFPEVRETLEMLAGTGRKMAVVSNCQEGYIPAFLKSMDMHQYFCDYEEWGRTGLLKADNIRLVMERNGAGSAVYVGDIQKDADASRQAGVPCIWASYGFGHIEEPAAVLEKFSDLPDAIEKLEGIENEAE